MQIIYNKRVDIVYYALPSGRVNNIRFCQRPGKVPPMFCSGKQNIGGYCCQMADGRCRTADFKNFKFLKTCIFFEL